MERKKGDVKRGNERGDDDEEEEEEEEDGRSMPQRWESKDWKLKVGTQSILTFVKGADEFIIIVVIIIKKI